MHTQMVRMMSDFTRKYQQMVKSDMSSILQEIISEIQTHL